MDLQNISIVAVIILTLFLGFSIFLHKSTSRKLNVSFLLLSLTLAFWSIAKVIFRYVEDPILTFYTLKAVYAIPILIPVFFLYITHIFPNKDTSLLKTKTVTILLSIIGFVGVSMVLFTNLIIKGAEIPEVGEKIVQFGDFYILFILHFTILFGLSYFALIKKFIITKDKLIKSQLMNLIVGTIIASLLGMLTNMILPWYGYNALNWLGNLTTGIFIGFVFYSIVRYHLFDLKIIATEVFVVFIISVLSLELFFVEYRIEFLIKLAVLLMVSLFGYNVIRSSYREIQIRRHNAKLAEELLVVNKKLKELDRLKSEFVSIASHQLRSPITAIKGYSSLLLEDSFGKLPKKASDAVEKIFDSSCFMACSVQDFLDVSNIDQGSMQYNFEVFDLKKVVKAIEEEHSIIANKKGLAFGLTLNESEKYMVKADLGKIRQVFSNIIDNAIKYTPKGSITITMSKNDFTKRIIVEIKDTGIGIPKETLRNLFTKFTRAENAYKVNVSGTGLGLYVAKQMIEAHKGRIWAISEGENKGSTFYIELAEYKEK